MSKADVTAAVYNYLTPENSGITHLGTVYTALPKVGSEADLFTFSYPGVGIGAVIFMFFGSQSEKRIALGGPNNGRKFRPYELTLLCIFKSTLEEPSDGQDAFNEFIDSLVDAIEADRTAGTSANSTGPFAGTGYVFQWGEGTENGGPDIAIEYPVPRTLNGGVMLYQAIARVLVCEILDT